MSSENSDPINGPVSTVSQQIQSSIFQPQSASTPYRFGQTRTQGNSLPNIDVPFCLGGATFNHAQTQSAAQSSQPSTQGAGTSTAGRNAQGNGASTAQRQGNDRGETPNSSAAQNHASTPSPAGTSAANGVTNGAGNVATPPSGSGGGPPRRQTSPNRRQQGVFTGMQSVCLNEQRPLFNDDTSAIAEEDDGDGGFYYTFDKSIHVRTLVQALHFMQLRRKLTDTVLISEDKRESFHFHGVLLSAASNVFKGLFANSQINFFRGTLHPTGATSKVLQNLFDFLYKPDIFSELLSNAPASIEFMDKFGLAEAFLENRFEPDAVLESFNELYVARTIAYTVLKVKDAEFACHAALVSAVAPGLLPNGAEGEFIESYEPIIVQGCEPETMEQLLFFVYTATIQLSEGFGLDALSNFCKWNVPVLVTTTCGFLKKKMTVNNVVRAYLKSKELGETYKNEKCQALSLAAMNFLIHNIKAVVRTQDFLTMVLEEDFLRILTIVMFKRIERGQLVAAVLAWYEQGARIGQNRQEAMCRLLSVITLAHDGETVGKMIHNVAKTNPQTCSHLTKAGQILTAKK